MNNRVKGIIALADPPPPPTLLTPYFETKQRPKGPKRLFLETALPLSQGLDDFPPPHRPRNLKVWISYCIESGNSLGKTQFFAYSLLTALFLPTLCLAANGKPVKPEGPVSY